MVHNASYQPHLEATRLTYFCSERLFNVVAEKIYSKIEIVNRTERSQTDENITHYVPITSLFFFSKKFNICKLRSTLDQ